MNHRQLLLAVAALAGALLGPDAAAIAHSGHDHGDAAPPPPPMTGSAAAASGEIFELVLKPDGAGGTLLYVADIDSNEPIAEAAIEVETGDSAMRAQATGSPGVYRLAWDFPAEPADLVITVSAAGRDDLLLMDGVAMAPATMVAAAKRRSLLPDDWQRWLTGGSAALAGLLGVGMIARRRGAVGAAVVLLALVAAGSAFAHGGHDHGGEAAAAETAVVYGAAVAMPKEAQFLLGVRTVRAEARDVADSVRLVGRVVPDPAGYARVQPSQQGRVVADGEHPLPVPGRRVTKGDVLVVIEPTLTALERAEQRSALARVAAAIIQTERQLERWSQMGQAARRKDVDDARLDLVRLREERTQIETIALGREMLRAPIDGIVTDVHVVPGEVIGPETTTIEVVDPDRLRVEAVLHDLARAEAIVGGQATTKLLEDHVFGLKLIGSGGRIDARDHGLHLIFAVTDGARLLKLGMPVDVHAQTGSASLRVSVPREAVADAGGRPVVFVKTAPERFEARPVKPGRTLGEWTELASGVKPGERVVVQGTLQLLATR